MSRTQVMRVLRTPLGDIDEERFYAERDSRTSLGGEMPVAEVPIAVVVPAGLEAVPGAQTALLWTCSMLRRIGRAFSRTIVIAPPGTPGLEYVGAFRRSGSANSLGAVLAAELNGADPFGAVEWRDLTAEAFEGNAMALWLGGYTEMGVPHPALGSAVIDAYGWCIAVCASGAAELPAPRPHRAFDAAAATLAMAAALGIAEVYRMVLGANGSESAVRLWAALDTGEVTTDAEFGEHWLSMGGARAELVPWSAKQPGRIPSLRHLALVSAGGLGDNAALLLADSHLRLERVAVIDDDQVDVSNLNRLIGIGVGDLGTPKVLAAARPLAERGIPVEAVVATYESWRGAGGHTAYLTGADAVLVGVDQVKSRLEVAGDWPGLLVNGATSGRGFVVSAHRPGICGCLGCYYGSAKQTYNNTRRAMACAGGGADAGPTVPQPMASYPHVSVAASASMVALLIHAAWEAAAGRPNACAGIRRQMDLLTPQFATTGMQQKVDDCLLLCGTEHVRQFLEQRAAGVAHGATSLVELTYG